MGLYFAIGLLYAFINGAIRKIDTHGDMLLPLVWIILWPVGILAIITAKIQKIFKL